MLTFETGNGEKWQLRFRHVQRPSRFRGKYGLLPTRGSTIASLCKLESVSNEDQRRYWRHIAARIAYCSMSDAFEKRTGRRVALEKLLDTVTEHAQEWNLTIGVRLRILHLLTFDWRVQPRKATPKPPKPPRCLAAQEDGSSGPGRVCRLRQGHGGPHNGPGGQWDNHCCQPLVRFDYMSYCALSKGHDGLHKAAACSSRDCDLDQGHLGLHQKTFRWE